jgi:hypothetical protein
VRATVETDDEVPFAELRLLVECPEHSTWPQSRHAMQAWSVDRATVGADAEGAVQVG